MFPRTYPRVIAAIITLYLIKQSATIHEQTEFTTDLRSSEVLIVFHFVFIEIA